jgi:hypothetical protein
MNDYYEMEKGLMQKLPRELRHRIEINLKLSARSQACNYHHLSSVSTPPLSK